MKTFSQFVKGAHYEDRMRDADQFHAALKKHGIRLTLQDK